MCCGRNRLLFSLTSAHPGPNNLNIEMGGCGGKVEAHFVQQAFLFPTPEPFQHPKQKKQNLERAERHKTDSQRDRETDRQLDT